MRVSQALARRAAGATKPSDSMTVSITYSRDPTPITAPMSGQVAPSRMVAPASMTSDGSRATSSVSFSRSSAHMPRVTLRTVEPAKLLACQSVEKRCTRWKALAAILLIILSVRKVRLRNTTWRSAVAPTPSAASIQKAVMAACQAVGSLAAPEATASTRRPAYSGVTTLASVDSRTATMMVRMRQGCSAQWRKVKPRTSL